MFDFKMKFSVLGFIVFMLPMIINIVYFKYPPLNAKESTGSVNRIVEMVEQCTRVIYAFLICAIVSNRPVQMKNPWLYIGVLFLVLYYIVWIRYFTGGRDVALLRQSFLFVPMPLAVFPVIYFICEAIWLHNYLAAISMVIFGVAHNIVSYASFR